MQTQAGWIEPKRRIYDHELVLIREGTYTITIEAETYTCEANSYIIIPPNQAHTTICTQAGIRDYAHFDWAHSTVDPDTPVMTFCPAQADTRLCRLAPKIIPTGIMHGTMTAPSTVLGLMDRIHLMLCHENPHERLSARAVLLEVLIRLLDPQTQIIKSSHHNESLASRVRSKLDKAMSAPAPCFSICDLLKELGHSYEHLSRVFRQQYSLTPNDYVQAIRIERAKVLLRQTDLILETIAQQIGYADAVYFSRLFKRHTGMSPGKFRSQ